MTEPTGYDLQVMIASGPEALPRAVLGFALAISAAASGARVLVVLALAGTTWLEGNEPSATRKINGFDSIENYLALLKEAGAAVRLCSACVMGRCAAVPAGAAHSSDEETAYVGLTEVAIRATEGTVQTVVF